MAKQVRQFRYYSDSERQTKNYPSGLTMRQLISGSAFTNSATKCIPILQLGIQGLPGTKFYLNNAYNPVIIGNTGIYELDLNGLSEITSLQFDQRTLQAINDNNNAYLIIDVIYEDGEG